MPNSRPLLQVSADTCDCGIHIYDTTTPLAATAITNGPSWATVSAYRSVQQKLGSRRVVVVQPTAYGTDNRCTVAAIADLGLDRARGIAVVDDTISPQQLRVLHAAGIRGARFQMLPGGALPWEMLEPVAARVAPMGWHIQLQMDGRLLSEREDMLARLPCDVMIDHVGKFLEPVTPDHPGFQSVLRLLERGNFWFKLAAAYEVSLSGPPDYADVGALAKIAARRFPERMVWASNWPHVAVATPPDDALLLDLLLDWVPDPAKREQLLVQNPRVLFGFP
jgi:D-galactarolactone isomerase